MANDTYGTTPPETEPRTPEPLPPEDKSPPPGADTWRKTCAFFKDPGQAPLASVNLLDRLLDWARGIFPVERFDAWATGFVKYGHLGLILAQLACILLGLTTAIRFDNWKLFPAGIGLALLLVILQYTAARFLDAGRTLVNTSPSRLSSPAFLDCLALLMEVLGLVVFFTCLFKGDLGLFFVGLAVWALCDAIAYIALHPEMVNIEVGGEVHAGEEAIGILSFGIKAAIRIVPIAFGVGAILGAIALLLGTFRLMATDDAEAAKAALGLIVFCLLLPFASYILLAFYHLTIDVLRAILVLPEKLEKQAAALIRK